MKRGRLRHTSVLLSALDLDMKLVPFFLVIWKNMAVFWHRHSLWIPSQVLSQRRLGGDGKPIREGGRLERERGGKERAYGVYQGFIVVCFPTINVTGSRAAKYTNSTMRWRARSSCGTWLQPHSGRWKTEEYLWLKRLWEHSTFSAAPINSSNPKI